jgi:hypothetical protein
MSFSRVSMLFLNSWRASVVPYQALKYRSVTDIVRPIREIVRRREEATGHSVRHK